MTTFSTDVDIEIAMYSSFMSLYVVEVEAPIITIAALVTYFLLMDCVCMVVQLALPGKSLLTYWTDVRSTAAAAFRKEGGQESCCCSKLLQIAHPFLLVKGGGDTSQTYHYHF